MRRFSSTETSVNFIINDLVGLASSKNSAETQKKSHEPQTWAKTPSKILLNMRKRKIKYLDISGTMYPVHSISFSSNFMLQQIFRVENWYFIVSKVIKFYFMCLDIVTVYLFNRKQNFRISKILIAWIRFLKGCKFMFLDLFVYFSYTLQYFLSIYFCRN